MLLSERPVLRNVLEIQAEIKVTLKKLGMFLVWFYVSLYTCVLVPTELPPRLETDESQVMQAAMGVTIKANAPFDSATFDWTEDEGIGMCAQTCAFECWSDELRAQLLGWALFWAIYSQYPGLC